MHPIIRCIDYALRDPVAEDWPAIEVRVSWNVYRQLLDIKGVTWTPTQVGRDATHEDRPLKRYRNYPLILTDNPDMVWSKMPDGSTKACTIVSPEILAVYHPNAWQ